MQLSWINNIEFAGSFIAKQKGYYTQHGVDVSLLTGGPSVESIPLLVAGKALVDQTVWLPPSMRARR